MKNPLAPLAHLSYDVKVFVGVCCVLVVLAVLLAIASGDMAVLPPK